ncbi:MAG: SDR family NAD(P)-dependent oxidoreductase [Rickettsiales bacterium]|jgi:short-subunit dehydrogenase|nr:SDR family NAD(P)-dependent oxidoreductase [Rickettsiales bacterium]
MFKNILITGASSGLGKRLAIDFSNKGVNLFLFGRNEERLKDVVCVCEKRGAKVNYNMVDVRDKDKMKELITDLDNKNNIDLVIANAGISAGTFGGDEPNEDVYTIFDINIYGVLNTIEPLIPKMIERKKGQISIISSMSSFIGMSGCPAYSSSKSCVSHYGEALRGYLKQYNIRVSVICPGFIRTPLTAKNKFAMPLIMDVDKASGIIKKGIVKNKGMIAFPFSIYILLKFIRLLPFDFVNYIFSKLPEK